MTKTKFYRTIPLDEHGKYSTTPPHWKYAGRNVGWIEEVESDKLSDGYHTFGELYEHRVELFITLCRIIESNLKIQSDGKGIWRSKYHSDGSSFDGWFIMGIFTISGAQISYHLPISKWEWTSFAKTLDKAPDFDGHTSKDVLTRLKSL